MKRRTSRVPASEISELSFGLLGTMADLSLVVLSLAAGFNRAAYTSLSTSTVLENAGNFFEKLQSKRLQKSLRHGLYQIADKGYRDHWKITDNGYRRLKQLVPVYRKERNWDGSFYLVIFDIPENLKRSRQELRKILMETGCGMLQESAWMSIADPEPAIAQLRAWHELEEFILILKTDKESARASEQLIPMVSQAFKLKTLNMRYKSFLAHIHANDHTPMELALLYLAILKDDPQLPFALLPKDWVGNLAFRTYKEQVIPRLPHQQTVFINAFSAL